MSKLSHLNESGEAHMVDVSEKDVTVTRPPRRAHVCWLHRKPLPLIAHWHGQKRRCAGHGAHCRHHGGQENV